MLMRLLSPKFLAILALSGSFIGAWPVLTYAQGNSGFTIFSGVERKDILDYYLQYGGRPGQWDRYQLYVPAKKLTQGARKFYISYPANFDGEFDPKAVRIRTKNGEVPVADAVWDKESRFLEISLAEDIPPNTKVDIVLSNVTNPDFGTYYLVCDVMASGDIPVRLYAGTWIVSIQR